jgi:hypothetical protein
MNAPKRPRRSIARDRFTVIAMIALMAIMGSAANAIAQDLPPPSQSADPPLEVVDLGVFLDEPSDEALQRLGTSPSSPSMDELSTLEPEEDDQAWMRQMANRRNPLVGGRMQFGWVADRPGDSLDNGIGIGELDAQISLATYPFFGPPPPFITPWVMWRSLDSSPALDLPDQLTGYGIDLTWIRPINKRWMLNLGISPGFYSDGENTSSDAWLVSARAFAIWTQNERWQWVFGALATGRADIPVIPAVGAMWRPTDDWLVDFIVARPRVAYRWFESDARDRWLYMAGALGGGTFAYQRSSGEDDQLTLSDLRLTVGFESSPHRRSGMGRPPPGLTWFTEAGFVFNRSIEFEHRPEIKMETAAVIRLGIGY